MFSAKEKQRKITITTEITESLRSWLRKDRSELTQIFNLSVRTHNMLGMFGVQKLEDLLSLTRKKLVEEGFRTKEQKKNLESAQANRHKTGVRKLGLPQKMGEVSMKEVDMMLQKLGLNLKGESQTKF